ncbi:MAG TPA: hypothetical protein VJ242_00815 [Patescibacteria group bacterium]|nr:hypothetical protein [Patescibacteria group bacterium]
MFHATLIIGGTITKRRQQAEKLTGIALVAAPDVLLVNPEPSITINQVRTLEKFLARRPLELKTNICVLSDADKLTLPAQNALLKSLEEPPKSAQIILLAETTAKLLPTVVSRCQVIDLGFGGELNPDELKKQQQIFEQITKAPVGERLTLAQGFAADAKTFCQSQLLFLRQPLKKANLKLAKLLVQSLKYLDANVNPKLVLELLLVNW